MKTINIYTDGACSGNQNSTNTGGWGCILEFAGHEKELHGGMVNSTNNRMELTALISALSALKEKGLTINVFSDSSYLVNCFKQHWINGWLKNGWKTAAKKDVENVDLWKQLLTLMDGQKLNFFLVKGHLELSSHPERQKAAYERFVKNNGTAFTFDQFLSISAYNDRCDELATRFQRECASSDE